ncbi:ATP-binding protein [Wenjunlia tyrosinilytica]|uniref:Histidine kinase/HSP90-like ATPase domain-containing protein n=1 Tax=Wenjunlia tyrosinilytica TaxID=1544741 RepID=A0A917ZEJ8_9ACTN|nr:ATP-binding protein [Wenjunlia tyrosinilytica]GGO80479.1 hypothetical protein GCM10012280_02490 [Wenjunlia tyrosinilytica]
MHHPPAARSSEEGASDAPARLPLPSRRQAPAGARAPSPVRAVRTAGPWTLPRTLGSCRKARKELRETLTAWGLEHLVPTAELLVSELVSNALRHTDGPLTLTLERLPGGLRAMVADENPRPPRLVRADIDDEGGRGIALVDGLADRWGVEPEPGGKAVWFELCG